VNDNTEELVAAGARILSVLWALTAAITLLFLCVKPGWNVAGAAALAVVYAASCAWLGFVKLANPEWKERRDVDAD
jgi:hypothetical protein